MIQYIWFGLGAYQLYDTLYFVWFRGQSAVRYKLFSLVPGPTSCMKQYIGLVQEPTSYMIQFIWFGSGVNQLYDTIYWFGSGANQLYDTIYFVWFRSQTAV
jgi:hypothetical protein